MNIVNMIPAKAIEVQGVYNRLCYYCVYCGEKFCWDGGTQGVQALTNLLLP